jgi:hypothetical protein
MSKVTIVDLIRDVNETPSEYEERYVRWVSIGYDKRTLNELLYELKYHKNTDTPDEKRVAFLESILSDYDLDELHRLSTNDEHTARFALIEKYARIGAMEMLIEGKYTIETLNIITQFPLADYQLTVKRIQELVNVITDITTQAASAASGVAGL